MARKLPAAPSLKRPTSVVDPKVEIHIVCEGRNTEPVYFEQCAGYYGNGLVKVIPVPGAGAPITIVQKARQLKEELIAQRRKSHNSFDNCFRVWVVFDRDEHHHIESAIAQALENGINVGFSNPCFELWPLLHLTPYGNQDGRHAVQRRLNHEMPGYDHESKAIVDFDMIKDSFTTAHDRAKILNTAREAENCPLGCPSTNVGELVMKIVQNGKKWTTQI